MRKVVFVMALAVGLMISFTPKCYAMTEPDVVTRQVERREGVTRADEIEKIYRWANGKIQYRRWNATQGYWVDAQWIDL